MEEDATVERLQRGDIAGLEALVRQHQIRAMRSAYLVTRDRALAEDVVQGAFLKAYERIGQLDVRRPFAPWFFKIVLNDAIKATVARERTLPLADPADDESAPSFREIADERPRPDLLWEQAETAGEVWAALRQLTPPQRAAVVSRYLLDRSESELARSLECSPGTVKWRLHAARERLRILLRPIGPE